MNHFAYRKFRRKDNYRRKIERFRNCLHFAAVVTVMNEENCCVLLNAFSSSLLLLLLQTGPGYVLFDLPFN